jgi:hypothetical protein
LDCAGGNYEKRIEKVTLATPPGSAPKATGKNDANRDRIVKRAAKEFRDGMYVNLGKYCITYSMYCFVLIKMLHF